MSEREREKERKRERVSDIYIDKERGEIQHSQTERDSKRKKILKRKRLR